VQPGGRLPEVRNGFFAGSALAVASARAALDPSIPRSLDPCDGESQPRRTHSLKDLVDAALRLDAELHVTRFDALTGEVIQAEARAIMDSKFPAERDCSLFPAAGPDSIGVPCSLLPTAATEGGVCGTEAAPATSQSFSELRPQTLSRILRAVLCWWRSVECFIASLCDNLTRDGRKATRLD